VNVAERAAGMSTKMNMMNLYALIRKVNTTLIIHITNLAVMITKVGA
jgi:hypothetical protein